MKYRPEIDGLRAIAVLPVILFHAGFGQFNGGFVGVDVFFVISGYLITNIIYQEISAGNFSIARFYERRARRILPALYLICVACIPFAYFRMIPSSLKGFSESLVAVNLFVSNFLFWSESGYFGTAGELKPLLHTWSLAIEEQFYIFFPLMLLLLRRLPRRSLIILIGATSLGSLAIAEYGSRYYPGANFYLLPSRAWELGVGALLSLSAGANRSDRGMIRDVGPILGLGLIGYAVFAFDEATRFPSLWAFIPVIGTALVIAYSDGNEIVGRILSWKPIVGMGLISYSAYLWHQPLFAFARIYSLNEPAIELYLALIAVTFAMAFLSWKFVESPFRNKRVMPVRTMTAWMAPVMVGIVAFGTIGYLENGFPKRGFWIHSKKYEADNQLLQEKSWAIIRSLSSDSSQSRLNNAFERTLWFDMKDNRSKILLVGNSHSKDLFNDLHGSQFAQEKYQIARYAIQLRDLLDNKNEFFDSPNYKHAQIIMLATRYNAHDIGALRKIIVKLVEEKKKVVLLKNIFEFREFYDANLSDLLLYKLSGSYNLDSDEATVAKIINKRHFDDYIGRKTDRIEFLAYNEEIERIGDEMSVLVLDRMDYICAEKHGLCYAIDEEYQKYFYDYGHHTLEGASFFGLRVDSTNWLGPVDKLFHP